MRTLLALVALPAVLHSLSLVACGSTSTGGTGGDASTGGGDSGGTDAGGLSDGSSSVDSAPPPDGGPCMLPATCTTATPVCCGTIKITGGVLPNCTSDPPTAVCSTSGSCPSMLGSSCSGTQIVRLCAATADCTETGYDKCCTFTRDGGSLSFCSSVFIAGLAGGTCM